MMRHFLKRYVIGVLNDLIRSRHKDIRTADDKIEHYEYIAKQVMAFLDSVRVKIADSEITEEEADTIVRDGMILIDQLFGKD